MKICCSLNNTRAADYALETKMRMCAACIDNDQLNCSEGEQIITAYRNQQNRETEAKKEANPDNPCCTRRNQASNKKPLLRNHDNATKNTQEN